MLLPDDPRDLLDGGWSWSYGKWGCMGPLGLILVSATVLLGSAFIGSLFAK
jgi:hypothetical protein